MFTAAVKNELFDIVKSTITDIAEIDNELLLELTTNIINNTISYLENKSKKLTDTITQQETIITTLEKEQNRKIDIEYSESNDFITEVDNLNTRISNEYNDYLMESLTNEDFKYECINGDAMIKQSQYLSHILHKYFTDNESIKLAVNEYFMKFITPGSKASIRGNRLNNIVDNIITSIQELQNDNYVITTETQGINIECAERPDFVIRDKRTNKEIIGYTQVDMWNSNKVRADKYITYKPHPNVHVLSVVARKAVIEYKKPTKNTRNIKYELFKYGYANDKICYVNNLHNIICKILGIEKVSDVNINAIVDKVNNEHLNVVNLRLSKYVDEYSEIIEDDKDEIKNNRIIERNNKKREYIINGTTSEYVKTSFVNKTDDFHFVFDTDKYDIAIVRIGSTVGTPVKYDEKVKLSANKYRFIKCDTDVDKVYDVINNNIATFKEHAYTAKRAKPYITNEEIVKLYESLI